MEVAAVVARAALLLCRDTDLVGLGPSLISGYGLAALGLATFEIPLPLPEVEIGMAWHPRHEADPAHRWLRSVVQELSGVVHNVSP